LAALRAEAARPDALPSAIAGLSKEPRRGAVVVAL
jgi:hypothetical protein